MLWASASREISTQLNWSFIAPILIPKTGLEAHLRGFTNEVKYSIVTDVKLSKTSKTKTKT